MVKKLKKLSESKQSGPDLASTIKESAQQIWLAGLGSFAKAQGGGTHMFETLVKEGLSMQRKTQTVGEDKIAIATQKMTDMANEIASKASGQWGKLENIFEDRVSRALGKLGAPSAKDMAVLTAQVAALTKTVAKLGGKPISPAKPKSTTGKTATKKATKPLAKAVNKRSRKTA